jgi:hypothetical protein
MNDTKPLFIMGSKCSGSTFLVNALNLHARVFVAHESDVLWILYQIYKDIPDRFRIYPLDAGKGMRATLDECSDILRSISSGTSHKEIIVQAFYLVLTHINEYGRGAWDNYPRRKGDLAWIGDKKPVQHSDPQIQAFLIDLFPEARYVHIIRNPRFVVASIVEAAETWSDVAVPEYWKETPQQVLERWATHEEWVLQVKSRLPSKVHTVRLEDLAEDPVRIMSETFSFLDLDLPPDAEEIIAKWAWKNPNRRHHSFDLNFSPRAYQIMQSYGYAD